MIYKLYIKYSDCDNPIETVGYPTDLIGIIKLLKDSEHGLDVSILEALYVLKAKKEHNTKYMDRYYNIISKEQYDKLQIEYYNRYRLRQFL